MFGGCLSIAHRPLIVHLFVGQYTSYPRVSRPEQFVRSSGSGRETKRELAAASHTHPVRRNRGPPSAAPRGVPLAGRIVGARKPGRARCLPLQIGCPASGAQYAIPIGFVMSARPTPPCARKAADLQNRSALPAAWTKQTHITRRKKRLAIASRILATPSRNQNTNT